MLSSTQLLKQYFGYDSFRPLQEEVIKAVEQNIDVLLLMPTGGGKSICYQLPALMRPGLTLVISPLIALMKDQVEALRENGIPCACLNSSQDYANESIIIRQCRNNEIKLLYISPEKAILIRNTLSDFPVSLIAIDEAHCISIWGHDFRPEYQQLYLLRELFQDVPVIALTATADKITRRDILHQLQLKEPSIFISSFDRKNLSLKVRQNIPEKIRLDEIAALINRYKNDTGIIYCTSRRGTELLCNKLQDRGFRAGFYHAGMMYEERNKIQERFIRDELQVICATIAFGMGIDKSNVRYVIHYNLPKNMEGYYQEIGRAGRDGLPSETILYFNLRDIAMLRSFAEQSGQRELNLEKLNLMQQYAEAKVCRRKILLNYFSEQMTSNCGNCDVCLNPPVYTERTELAQKIIRTIMETTEKVGFTMLINILRGSRNTDLLDKKYDLLQSYGKGKEYNNEVWMYYIMQLLQNGLLEIAYDEGHTLKITDTGKRVYRGESKIYMAIYQESKPATADVSVQSRPDETHQRKLFEELRKLRRMIADSEGVPPYIIFSDATLNAMSEDMPVTAETLMNIPGISERKLEKYGDEFIKVIRNFLTENKLSQPPSVSAITKEEIERYIQEMKSGNVEISLQSICYILSGSETKLIGSREKQLSFYGKLRGRMKQKTIYDTVFNMKINI